MRFINYLKFLIKSTNQHGVHSPFVFNFITKGLYKKNNTLKQIIKQHKTVSEKLNISFTTAKTITYFKPKTILCIGEIDNGLNNFLLKYSSSNNTTLLKIDLHKNQEINTLNSFDIIISNAINEEIIPLLKKCHNDSVLIVHNINKNPKSYALWQQLKLSKNVKVTIDSFILGIIFFRKEQVKEHFTIRL